MNGDTVILDGNASIGVEGEGYIVLSDSISGTGDFTKLGSGALSFGKSGSLIGNFFVEEGKLEGRSNVVRGDLFIQTGASIAAFGGNMVNAPDNHAEVDGTWNLNARGDDTVLSHQIGSISGSGTIISTDPTDNPGGTVQIRAESGSAEYAGSITGLVNIEKTGNSTQVFSGILAHSGTTQVNGGILQVDGSHTGGGDYTVNDGGTLGGNGDIDSALQVNAGGRLAPGASAGSLSVNDVTLSSGSFFDVELDGSAAGIEYDQLIADSATLGGVLSVSLLDSSGSAFEPMSTDTFTVLASSATLTGAFENVASGDRLETSGGEGSFLVTYSGDNAVLLSDFVIVATAYDFGDAPVSYGTLAANDGARHIAVGPQLGASRDAELNGVPSAGADGDGIDEDGAMFGGIGVNSTVAAVNIELSGASEGKVDAWVDFNRNGIFDISEKIIDDVLINQSMQTLNYDLPGA